MSLGGFTTGEDLRVTSNNLLDGANYTAWTVLAIASIGNSVNFQVHNIFMGGTANAQTTRAYWYFNTGAGSQRLGMSKRYATTVAGADTNNGEGPAPNSGWNNLAFVDYGHGSRLPTIFWSPAGSFLTPVNSYRPGRAAGVGAPTAETADWRIGNAGDVNTRPWVSDLFAFLFFPRALEQRELHEWQFEPWREERGNRRPLIQYVFDSKSLGTSGTVYDRSGYGNHATFTGALTLADDPPILFRRPKNVVYAKAPAGAPVLVTPGVASLTTTTFAPTVSTSDNKRVVPSTASLVTSLFAPTVSTSDNKRVVPTTASLVTSLFAPTVSTTDHKRVVPGVASLTLTTFAPDVSAGQGLTLVPSTASLSLTTFAPTVTTTANQRVVPGTASLVLTPFAPTVRAPRLVTPNTASLSITLFEPTVVVAPVSIVTVTNRGMGAAQHVRRRMRRYH